MRRITVDDLLLQSVVSMINLGGRRLGLAPGTEGDRDLEQVRTAIDAVSALLPLLEGKDAEAVRPIRDALAQLQMAYAQAAGAAAPAAPGGQTPGPAGPSSQQDEGLTPSEGQSNEGPGPAQSSGKLWVPGQ
jgi:hypothetical protein